MKKQKRDDAAVVDEGEGRVVQVEVRQRVDNEEWKLHSSPLTAGGVRLMASTTMALMLNSCVVA